MSFTTKKYTRPVLIKEVRKLSTSNFTNVSTFVNALSPRAGSRSAKVSALRRSLSVSLNRVFQNFSGSEAKQTIIAALNSNLTF